MPTKATFQLSPEQLAIQAARREAKAKKIAAEKITTEDQNVPKLEFIKREFLPIGPGPHPSLHVKIMSWNMLAQSLVRRDLFPGSDCLKGLTRERILPTEILAYNPDIACLQEVDRVESLLNSLSGAQYSYTYATGRQKSHGCMILHKKTLFDKFAEKTVYYDEEHVSEKAASATVVRSLYGLSRITRNIGLLVALRSKSEVGPPGFIVATTHLFWHPAYSYERTKQVGILLRAVERFQSEHGLQGWPCILAGDFNSTPEDTAYSLLVGEEPNPIQIERFESSRVVHISVDPSVAEDKELRPNVDEEGGGSPETQDPDKVIINTRGCTDSDGLPSLEEVRVLFKESRLLPLRSAYNEGLSKVPDELPQTCQEREPTLRGRKGAFEPNYTSFTFHWKNTIDYIFLANDQDVEYTATVQELLRPFRKAELGLGLPQIGICASDHVSLVATIAFAAKSSS